MKHKGWSAASPPEAMARYGTSFRGLALSDNVIPPPSPNSKLMPTTPGNTMSPLVKSSVAEVFTFHPNDTKMFTQATKVVVSFLVFFLLLQIVYFSAQAVLCAISVTLCFVTKVISFLIFYCCKMCIFSSVI